MEHYTNAEEGGVKIIWHSTFLEGIFGIVQKKRKGVVYAMAIEAVLWWVGSRH